MKTLFAIISLILFSHLALGQNIPNGDMENWVTSGNYADPLGWDSPNQQTTALPFIGAAVVTKSNDAHSGSFSARLENKSFVVFTVPGILTLGQLDVNLTALTFALTGGVPFTQRPEKIKGYYKYSPQGGDSCAVLAIFYKYNPGGWRDTVGIAYYLDNSTVTQWTQFEAFVDWYSADTPDSMNIVLSSASNFTPTAGSVFQVDDLVFDYTTALTPVAQPKDEVSIRYLSELGQVRVDYTLPVGNRLNISVMNITGQPVAREESTSQGKGRLSLNLPDLVPGVYIVVFQSGDLKRTRKIVLR